MAMRVTAAVIGSLEKFESHRSLPPGRLRSEASQITT
jgi:hypothetical protein